MKNLDMGKGYEKEESTSPKRRKIQKKGVLKRE